MDPSLSQSPISPVPQLVAALDKHHSADLRDEPCGWQGLCLTFDILTKLAELVSLLDEVDLTGTDQVNYVKRLGRPNKERRGP